MALSAQELRIGNWYNEYGIPKQATSDFIDRLYIIQKAGKTALDVSDIPITEEWLWRFGDDQVSEIPPIEVIVQDRFLFIWKEPYHYWYVVTLGSHEYLTKIEFVHEYQNFIFTLTGEELVLSK